MNDRRDNEEREALIADDLDGDLTPEQAAELALLADVLGDPSAWAEPSAELEDAVVASVLRAEPTVAPARRRSRYGLAAVASIAAAIAITVGAVAVTNGSGTKPDFSTALAATSLAPGAHGSAKITHNRAGFRIVLDARGLAPLPAGEYYQGWVKNAAGTLVPIGTFSSTDGKVTLWSGVSPKDFPKLTVTIEATDNDQASSGRVVLSGTIGAR